MTPSPDAARPLRGAHRATLAAFFVFGFGMAQFGVHVPSIRQHHGLSDATLALALLAVAVGAVACLALAGRLIAAQGVRRVAAVSGLSMCALLALLLQGQGLAWLLPLMVAQGAAIGLFDVAINTEGSAIEARLGRPVLSVMHGLWSLGGMSGGALGAALLARTVPPALQLPLAALACAVVVALLVPWLGTVPPATGHAAGQGWRDMPRSARATLAGCGVLAVLALMAEGAMYDWAVLYLQRERSLPPAQAASGFAVFSGAMAVGRLSGDALRRRVAPQRLLAGSALLAAAAMTAALLVAPPLAVLLALAGVGLGLANAIPLLFAASARVPGATPAAGLAVVSSLGWLGVVLGPPIVGGVSETWSLSAGLALVVVASLALALGSRWVARS